jgi:3-methyladenine DNA glycosylase AlkD
VIPEDAFAPQLAALLAEGATAATREHWTAYLKGAARFRGTPMAGVRRSVRTLVAQHDLGDEPVEDVLACAGRWFAADYTEEKLAAVLLVAEHLAPRLRDSDAAALAEPFQRGHIADWNVCDWYATKALHAYLAHGDLATRAPVLAAWTTSELLWQRRGGLVAFVPLARTATDQYEGFIDLVLQACQNNLVSEDRFAHTGPGWVLRELSVCAPERVAQFVEEQPLSGEARRMATARLRPGPYRRR